MKYAMHLLATATMSLTAGCVGLGRTSIQNDVPPCERLIPAALLEPTPFAAQPVSAKLPDGHDDARPWQAGFLEQTGQKEIADLKAPAVDHIYRECLKMHRDQLKRDTRGFFGRLFGFAGGRFAVSPAQKG